MSEHCESCGHREVSKLIYFNDGGPTFAVCRSCGREADDRGCSVFELEDSA